MNRTVKRPYAPLLRVPAVEVASERGGFEPLLDIQDERVVLAASRRVRSNVLLKHHVGMTSALFPDHTENHAVRITRNGNCRAA